MSSRFWKNVNLNKWGKDTYDCAIRSLVAATGLDYELVCKKLGVKCVPGEGYNDPYGVDWEVIEKKFKQFLGPTEDNLDNFDDPFMSLLAGEPLEKWLRQAKAKGRDGAYLVYLDDNKQADGGHVVCCVCRGNKSFFVDTADVSGMFVQCWAKVEKRVPATSKYHWKNNKPVDEALTRTQAEEFRRRLREGEVKFKYRKNNGEERVARGTMDPDVIPSKPDRETTRNLPDDSVFYYDLDAEDFRSFKMRNFIEYLDDED